MDSAILVNEAMKLPPLERARIIDALWSSLAPGEQDAVDQAALLEAQDRLAAFRAGQLTAMNGEDPLRAIEDELTPNLDHQAAHKGRTATGPSASSTEKVPIVRTHAGTRTFDLRTSSP